MKRWKFRKRHLLLAPFVLMILFAAFFLVREYISNILVGYVMDAIDLPKRGDRVLVFAPHSDDESLGPANLIKKSIQNGAVVKIVMATNGDGFRRAVGMEYGSLNPTSSNYIEYGYTRQSETIDALTLLGINEEDVIFLSYPDGGLSRMWGPNWMRSHPFFSRYTQTNKSPYENTYDPKAVYSGQDLYDNIKGIIEDFQPTDIVYPHPNDHHPDHWALNAFVKYVVSTIGYKAEHQWLYLVHRGDWPTPLAHNTKIFLVPPSSLLATGTKWHALDMSDEEITQKSIVLHQYRSQYKRIGRLMAAFERKNELFGEYSDAQLLSAQHPDLQIAPNDQNFVIKDASKDAVRLGLRPEADIVGINSEISMEGNLHVYVRLKGNPDLFTAYRVNMIFIEAGKSTVLNLQIKGRRLSLLKQRDSSIKDADGIQLEVNKNILHLMIPGQKIGAFDSVFMNADSLVEGYFMDHTAWRLLDVIDAGL